jgi:RND family efflux transporter MFP subunit
LQTSDTKEAAEESNGAAAQPAGRHPASGQRLSPQGESESPGVGHQDQQHPPVHSRPGTGFRLSISVLLLGVGLVIAFILAYHHRAAEQAELAKESSADAEASASVDVVAVAYSPSGHLLTLPGKAAAWFESTIYARVSGYVDHWKADIGDRVKKGDVLATIDTPEIDDQLKAAHAKVAADQSEVAVAQSNADFAKLTNKRYKTSPAGVVSEQERDEKEAGYASAMARLEAARSQVQFDQAEVNRLEALTEFKKVLAPYDGVITKRQIDVGDLVTAGSTASTSPLYDIAQSDRIRVFVDVPQAASSEIRDGMQARVTDREFPGRVFSGTVSRTSRSIDAAKTLTVEVDIENQDLTLLPGMYLEASFTLESTVPTLRVPASALSFRSGGPQVAVVDGGGVVNFHSVIISRDMGDFVEVGSGLSSGDKVALNISNQIADGDRVSVLEASSPEAEPKPKTVHADTAHGAPASD